MFAVSPPNSCDQGGSTLLTPSFGPSSSAAFHYRTKLTDRISYHDFHNTDYSQYSSHQPPVSSCIPQGNSVSADPLASVYLTHISDRETILLSLFPRLQPRPSPGSNIPHRSRIGTGTLDVNQGTCWLADLDLSLHLPTSTPTTASLTATFLLHCQQRDRHQYLIYLT